MHTPPAAAAVRGDDEAANLFEFVAALRERWMLVLIAPLLAGLVTLGATYLVQPVFVSRTVFLPPQQQQSAAATAAAQLGALSSLIGGATGIKSPADQYVALLQSTSVADRLIDQFNLMQAYGSRYRFEARAELAERTRITLGKRDGLIAVEVEDTDPQRAAAIANRHVEELRRLISQLALTEAQQRRMFFEEQLAKTRDELTAAQLALQASGFNPGALKAEPRAAAEGYAKLRAEATAAEVRLQTLRRNLAETTPEVQQAQATVNALRGQLARAEAPADPTGGPDYVSKFREFKYQETLFDLFSRQYEIARLDESREGALVQVVDVAQPAEYKSRPKRALTAIAAAGATLIVVVTVVLLRRAWRLGAARSRAGPAVG